MAEDNLKKILGGVTKITPFKQAKHGSQGYNYGGESSLTAGTWDVKSAMDPLLNQFNKKMEDSSKGKCPEGYELKDGKCVLKDKDTDKDKKNKEESKCDCEENYLFNDPCYEECKTDEDEEFDGECDCCGKDKDAKNDESHPCYSTCFWEDCPEGIDDDTDKCPDTQEEQQMCAAGDYGPGWVWNDETCDCEPEPESESEPEPEPEPEPGPNTEGTDGGDGTANVIGSEGNPYSNASEMLNSEQFANANVGDVLNIKTSGPSSVRSEGSTSGGQNYSYDGGKIVKTENGFAQVGTTGVSVRGGVVNLESSSEWEEQENGMMVQTKKFQHKVGMKNGYNIDNIKENKYINKKGKLKSPYNEKYKDGTPKYITQTVGDKIHVIKNVVKKGAAKSKTQVEDERLEQENEQKIMQPLLEMYDKYRGSVGNFLADFESGEHDGCLTNPNGGEEFCIKGHGSLKITRKEKEKLQRIFKEIQSYQNKTKARANYIPNIGDGPMEMEQDSPLDKRVKEYLVNESQKFRSPFEQNIQDNKIVSRDTWMPSHVTIAPDQLNSPMKQDVSGEEPPVEGGQLPTVEVGEGAGVNSENELWNIWKKIHAEIDTKLATFNFEKWIPGDKAKKLFSGATIGNFTKFLEKVKEGKVAAIKNKDKETQAKIDTSFQNFIQQATVEVPAKYQAWTVAMGGGEGELSGAPTMSLGNHKISAMRDNLFFMSSDLSDDISPVIDVMEDGSLAVKLGNSPAVRLNEIGSTFSIDFIAKKSFLDFLAINEQDAIAGKPVNEKKNLGIAKQIFGNNINTALSGMFDQFYGESLYDSLPPNAGTWMHPESNDFDAERVINEVIGYYAYKLNEAHMRSVPKVDLTENPAAMSAAEIINKLS